MAYFAEVSDKVRDEAALKKVFSESLELTRLALDQARKANQEVVTLS